MNIIKKILKFFLAMIVLTIIWFLATFISVGVFAFAFWIITNIVIPIGVVVIVTIVLMAIAFYVVTSFMD
ncbi:MAG: hypothetical protein ACLT61_07635 [Anaerostipes hadrus]